MAEDVEVGGTGTGYGAKDYRDPPPAPLIDPEELTQWSFYRAIISEFIATNPMTKAVEIHVAALVFLVLPGPLAA